MAFPVYRIGFLLRFQSLSFFYLWLHGLSTVILLQFIEIGIVVMASQHVTRGYQPIPSSIYDLINALQGWKCSAEGCSGAQPYERPARLTVPWFQCDDVYNNTRYTTTYKKCNTQVIIMNDQKLMLGARLLDLPTRVGPCQLSLYQN